MIPAVADTKAAFSISIYFEKTKSLLVEATAERDEALLRRANIKMQDDRFEDLPIESQRELNRLFLTAMLANGWGTP